jgi:hypothetical protein
LNSRHGDGLLGMVAVGDFPHSRLRFPTTRCIGYAHSSTISNIPATLR